MADRSPQTTRRGVGDVCAECVRKNGGVWPKDHLATMSHGQCDACGDERTVCSPGDWNWPQGLPRGWIDGGRD